MYRQFCDLLGTKTKNVEHWQDIPFLPIEFFKTENVLCGSHSEITFISSGTTGVNSKHQVKSLAVYEKSFTESFNLLIGDSKSFCFCCLLPSYLERKGSSLVYMADALIKASDHPESGFYLSNHSALHQQLMQLKERQIPTILLGVSFALLDFLDDYQMDFPNLKVMETGGMKGRREEITRHELHEKLRKGFGVSRIYSEYGMTELLSQSYSKGDGLFQCPPWMKVVIRDISDPLTFTNDNKTGGVNIIDLANIYSCAFISTSDLGRSKNNGFEIMGRLDSSDIRGCNLMVSNLL